MESQNYLGIYWAKNAATVVCIANQGKERKVLDLFSVTAVAEEEDALSIQQKLALEIKQQCDQKNLEFEEVAVALDCSMFMQHDIHSEFKEQKQISATIRFDTEEALATDVSNVAIGFKINSTDSTGSELTVYTVDKNILSEIIFALQSNNMDPITVEPDINCLSGFIKNNFAYSEDMTPFYAIFSDHNAYLIAYPQQQTKVYVRTFLINPDQDRTSLALREIPLTISLMENDDKINCLRFYDVRNNLDAAVISQKMMLDTGPIDFAGSVGVDTTAFDGFVNLADFAIAYGAAIIAQNKNECINFRDDFMPYRGKKLKLEKKIKMIGIIAAAVIFILGCYFQFSVIKVNSNRKKIRAKFAKDYSGVMQGKKLPDRLDPLRKLKIELKRIEDRKSGQLSLTGQASISTKLTMLLKAFNEKAKEIDLKIDSVTISGKNISIDGTTSTRDNTLELYKVLEKYDMEKLQDRLSPDGVRDNFRITVAPKK